jgi:hypothetical protein
MNAIFTFNFSDNLDSNTNLSQRFT